MVMGFSFQVKDLYPDLPLVEYLTFHVKLIASGHKPGEVKQAVILSIHYMEKEKENQKGQLVHQSQVGWNVPELRLQSKLVDYFLGPSTQGELTTCRSGGEE